MAASEVAPQRAPSPAQALRHAWTLFKVRPWSTMSVATALLLSLFAVCCGLGVVAAPWFMCELFALQISSGTGRGTTRSSSWLWAGLVQLLAVMVLCSLAFLTLLALGPDVVLGSAAQAARPANARLIESLGLLLGAGGLALSLLVHFEHAPSILIDRGGSLRFALLESARLVAETGVVRSWLTSTAAHGLQLAPAVVVTVLAVSQGTLASTVVWGGVALPVMAFCLALGQGMIVSSYLALRDDVPMPSSFRDTRLSSRTSALWLALLLLVGAGPLLVSSALIRPAPVAAGALPAGAEPIMALDAQPARELYIPDTALRLALGTRQLRVLASDGGGAGTLALPAGKLVSVRVARGLTPPGRGVAAPEPAFAIEATVAGQGAFTTWIDDAGVRLDDSLGRRFAALLPGASSVLLLSCLLWTAVWFCMALPRQAQLQKHHRAGTQLVAQAYERRALRSALWLLPAALVSTAVGVWAAAR
jgi:hypothetical protein